MSFGMSTLEPLAEFMLKVSTIYSLIVDTKFEGFQKHFRYQRHNYINLKPHLTFRKLYALLLKYEFYSTKLLQFYITSDKVVCCKMLQLSTTKLKTIKGIL